MNSRLRIVAALAAVIALAGQAAAQIIVDENFDGYADNDAFRAVWVPTVGNGTAAADPANNDAGVLDDGTLNPGVVTSGKVVDHIGVFAGGTMVNQYGGVINQGLGLNPAFNAVPSATKSVFVSVDLYDSGGGNERMTLGLRHISVAGETITTTNLLEMGLYNSNSGDPTVVGVTNPPGNAAAGSPGFYNGRGYGARLNLYGAISSPLVVTPDWQYFRTDGETWGLQDTDLGFDIGLESTTDTNDYVSIGDIGAGWHTYSATITPTHVTFEIDLWRDGLRNTSRTPDSETGIRPGEPDLPDARMVFPIATLPQGFNSLRIGGPSGLSSAGAGVTLFDNIRLEMIDVVQQPLNADFDTSMLVDGSDFLTWQRNYPVTDGTAVRIDGDANEDGNVNAADLDAWKLQYGTNPNAAVAVAAVPEPASLLLAALAGLAGCACRRRAA
ncbi:MAG: PEP-CTERM sorting domain-containing protein [Pirellulales bacterium]|nr:PEP-CTERM sorting domain-containing protein [Pirellulales bacterium]